jgi:hypothetical protein
MILTVIVTNQVLCQEEVFDYPHGVKGDHCSIPLAMLWSIQGQTGVWKAIDDYWINLLAHKRNGTFISRKVGSTTIYSMLNTDDVGKQREGFWLMEGPRNDDDPDHWWGTGSLVEPRNQFCLNYNLYWRRDRNGHLPPET